MFAVAGKEWCENGDKDNAFKTYLNIPDIWSIWFDTATGLAGAFSYGMHDSADIESAVCITACAMVTVRFGAKSSTKLSEIVLKRMLGLFMIGVAPLVSSKEWIMLCKEESQDSNIVKDGDRIDTNRNLASIDVNKVLVASAIGTASGFLSGLFGVGELYILMNNHAWSW